MSESAPEVFDTTMRMVIHALPYRLSVTEAADLVAQLPSLIRGIFYKGWCLRRKPDKAIDREEFLSRVENVFALEPDVDPERVIRTAIGVL